MKSNLCIHLFLAAYAFGILSKETLPILSSKSFIVPAFTFRSLVHFELNYAPEKEQQ